MNINGTIIYHNYIIFEKSLFTHLNYNVYENVVFLISYEVEIIFDNLSVIYKCYDITYLYHFVMFL